MSSVRGFRTCFRKPYSTRVGSCPFQWSYEKPLGHLSIENLENASSSLVPARSFGDPPPRLHIAIGAVAGIRASIAHTDLSDLAFEEFASLWCHRCALTCSRCCTIMPGWHTSVCRFSYLRETLANVIRESVVPLHKRMGLTCPSSAKLGGAYLSSHQVGTTHFSRIGFSLDKSCQVGTSLEKWVISLHTHPSFDK